MHSSSDNAWSASCPRTTSTSSSPCPTRSEPPRSGTADDRRSARQPAVGRNPIVTHGSGQLLTHARTQHRCSCQTGIPSGDGYVVFALDEILRRHRCRLFGSDAATAVGPNHPAHRGCSGALLRAPMPSATSAASQDPHGATPTQRGSVQSRFAEVLARCGSDAQLTLIVSLDFSKPLLNMPCAGYAA